jgi:hypothetical protein
MASTTLIGRNTHRLVEKQNQAIQAMIRKKRAPISSQLVLFELWDSVVELASPEDYSILLSLLQSLPAMSADKPELHPGPPA